jgi:hypothetical protein
VVEGIRNWSREAAGTYHQETRIIRDRGDYLEATTGRGGTSSYHRRRKRPPTTLEPGIAVGQLVITSLKATTGNPITTIPDALCDPAPLQCVEPKQETVS